MINATTYTMERTEYFFHIFIKTFYDGIGAIAYTLRACSELLENHSSAPITSIKRLTISLYFSSSESTSSSSLDRHQWTCGMQSHRYPHIHMIFQGVDNKISGVIHIIDCFPQSQESLGKKRWRD